LDPVRGRVQFAARDPRQAEPLNVHALRLAVEYLLGDQLADARTQLEAVPAESRAHVKAPEALHLPEDGIPVWSDVVEADVRVDEQRLFEAGEALDEAARHVVEEMDVRLAFEVVWI